MSPKTPCVELRGLQRSYRAGGQRVHALAGVDLAIDSGECVAITGPSGSGKSTLLQILGCLDRPTAGEYRLDGRDVGSLPERERARVRNRRLGFVFQGFHLLPRVDALGNVELPLLYAFVARRERRERARRALEAVGLGARMHHRPDELSGGQRQRVAIARALVTEPSLVLADEPTGNLDSATGAEILGLFDSLRTPSRAWLIVTHDPVVAARAERVVALRDGRIVSDERREGALP